MIYFFHLTRFASDSNTKSEMFYPLIAPIVTPCAKCGSSLNRSVLIQKFGQRANYCPLCGADFRSPTVLKAIANAKERYEKVCAELKEAEKKAARNSKEIQWLVKIEYHT